MTNVILLNAIPALFIIAALTLVCWLPSLLAAPASRRQELPSDPRFGLGSADTEREAA